MRIKMFFLVLAMFALVLGGCKDDSNPAGTGPTGPTVYTGVMAGTGVSGSISISIPTAKRAYPEAAAEGDTLEITGTLKINGGASIMLTGYYVVDTGELSLTGGGYTFFGFVENGSVTGTFTYSGGSGVFSADQGNSSSVTTICGTYQDNSPGTESGFFNMTISGSTVVVVVSPAGGGGGSYWIDGTLSGTTITIYNPEAPTVPVATGTLNTSNHTVSGTYAGDPGGTWSGAPCN